MRLLKLLPALVCIVLACEDEPTGPVADFVAEGTTFSPTSATTSATHTTIIWGFAGGPHTVTFEDAATGSGQRTGGIFSRNFAAATPGTYRFRCEVHSTDFTTGMTGSVIVPP